MIYEVMPVGPLRCNCSVLVDEISHEAIVVDPGDDIEEIVEVLHRHSARATIIVVTHAHIDHIAGAARLKRLTGAPVLYNQHDLPLVAIMDEQASWLGVAPPEVQPPDDDLREGRVLTLGNREGVSFGGDAPLPAISAEVLHTPGHTPGSICLYLHAQKMLLAGDTLFAGSIGRTDLPGGETATLVRSIREKLLVLPEETVVVPGHGSLTTIGREQDSNPFVGRGRLVP